MVIVLGAGRSGTSLLMQVLVGMGLQVSDNLNPANVSNPEGFFEDTEIQKFHAELIVNLGSTAYIPLPDGWMTSEAIKAALPQLKALVSGKLESASGVFGIKDPRISILLPLWVRILNLLKLVPRFVLAMRSPADVVASMIRQYNDPSHIAELAWLARTVEALENTAADCFIVHYEDWFSGPMPLAKGLLQYTGLHEQFKGDLSEVLANTLKPNLNRARHGNYQIQNPYVLKLYAALKECRGADFDRERLMAVVKECRQAMNGFRGWYEIAHTANKQLAETREKLEKARAEAAKVKELEKEKALSQQLATQVRKLQQQLDQLMAMG
jgi:hypothetical protein